MANVGDRVLAQWPAEMEWWYPGVVVASTGAAFDVRFDDGGSAALRDDQTRPLLLAIGARVSARFRGGDAFYSGIISEAVGNALHICYDDGDKEWTSVSMLRVHERDL